MIKILILIGILFFILITSRLFVAWTFHLATDILILSHQLQDMADEAEEEEDAIEFEMDDEEEEEEEDD